MTGQATSKCAAVNAYNPYAAQPLYLANDFELASFCIVSGPALHLDNTFLENDYPQLSCLA